MTQLPFVDLKSQYARLKTEIAARIDNVLEHGQYIMGPEVFELEEQLARYVGVKHAVSCSSGTDALLMALMAYDIGPGDAVITTPFTFISTAEVVALLGATPVFVDIDPQTFNIDTQLLEQTILKTKKEKELNVRGIIPVDLFGLPADYNAIADIADRHGLFVLEDAAQSFGAQYHGKRAGSFGDVAATSFFPAKPLGGYGDGGAVFTNDDNLAQVLISIRIHGTSTDKYNNVRLGLTGRLDTLQAAILLAKLGVFDSELAARQKVATRYTEKLKNLVQTPSLPRHYTCAWAQYSVQSPRRDEIQAALKNAGVPTAVYYGIPLHLQTVFANLGYKAGDFPVSEEISRRIFSLPMHPYMESDQIDRISGIIEATLAAKKIATQTDTG